MSNAGFVTLNRVRKYGLETCRGWADYRSGAPFPAEYDTWNPPEQRNYENGRLRAANVKAAFGKIAARPSRKLILDAADIVGNAIPRQRIVA